MCMSNNERKDKNLAVCVTCFYTFYRFCLPVFLLLPVVVVVGRRHLFTISVHSLQLGGLFYGWNISQIGSTVVILLLIAGYTWICLTFSQKVQLQVRLKSFERLKQGNVACSFRTKAI